MSFFSSRTKEEIVALFDISSGSVGGAFVLLSSREAPTLLSTKRISLPLRSRAETKTLLHDVSTSLETIIQALQKTVARVPEKVYVTLSSPWLESSLKIIRRKHPGGIHVTKNFIEGLVQQEVEHFEQTTEGFDEIIDRQIVQILLNGYEVERPYGKRAQEVDVHLFLGLSHGEVIDEIEKTIERAYHRPIRYVSEPLVHTSTVRDIYDDLNDFLIVSVGEEITEVTVLQHDVFLGMGSFPYGTNTALRDMSRSLGISLEEAQSQAHLFHASHLHDDHTEEIQSSIFSIQATWQRELKKVLRAIYNDVPLPHTIFFVGNEDAGAWFLDSLSGSHFTEFTTTEDNFHVIIAGTRVLHDFCNFSFDAQRDARLITQSIFINTINF